MQHAWHACAAAWRPASNACRRDCTIIPCAPNARLALPSTNTCLKALTTPRSLQPYSAMASVSMRSNESQPTPHTAPPLHPPAVDAVQVRPEGALGSHCGCLFRRPLQYAHAAPGALAAPSVPAWACRTGGSLPPSALCRRQAPPAHGRWYAAVQSELPAASRMQPVILHQHAPSGVLHSCCRGRPSSRRVRCLVMHSKTKNWPASQSPVSVLRECNETLVYVHIKLCILEQWSSGGLAGWMRGSACASYYFWHT